MSEMNLQIGTLDSATRTVPVTFTLGEIVHKRSVNAVIRNNGTHDRAATIERVNDVARGVAEKIRVGAITVPVAPASDEPESD
jgi:hypothetical protein